ncbi:MAG: thioredoxin-dependent thiol peroxidase [Bradymonadales bacterium]|nr:thioredoxin-dependent thiol peroxidase [Bradymonadales bacterium]
MTQSLLKAGDPIPPFAATLDDGREIASDDLTGKRTVLYFYPKNDTPGCTTEACDFRDHFARLTHTLGLQILGVSPDSVASHTRFKTKHQLPFPLLSDPDHSLATAFGVWQEKKRYGKTSMGIVRSTFVIAPDGTIEKAFYNVRATGHVENLLKALS